MLLFHDPVSALQFLGFSIALGGLVYYQLGGTPTFVGYWHTLRSQYGASKLASPMERRPSDLEAQTLINEEAEPLPEIKTVVTKES